MPIYHFVYPFLCLSSVCVCAKNIECVCYFHFLITSQKFIKDSVKKPTNNKSVSESHWKASCLEENWFAQPSHSNTQSVTDNEGNNNDKLFSSFIGFMTKLFLFYQFMNSSVFIFYWWISLLLIFRSLVSTTLQLIGHCLLHEKYFHLLVI